MRFGGAKFGTKMISSWWWEMDLKSEVIVRLKASRNAVECFT